MQDNTRYTAMRLFQDIEGSETVYINTYAASTPRLQAFRNICSSAKDNGEDFFEMEEEEQDLASSAIPRELFRSNTMWKNSWIANIFVTKVTKSYARWKQTHT